MNGKRFSLAEAIRFGFYTLVENFSFYLGLMFTYLGVMLAGSAVAISLAMLPYAGRIIEMLKVLENAGVPRGDMALNVARQLGPELGATLSLAAVVLYFLNRYLALGFSKVALNFYDKKNNNTISTLFSQYPLILKDAAATFLYWLICFFGLVALVAPGIYLSITFGFYHLFIVDENVGIIEAFKKSAALTHGAKWELFSLTILFTLLNYAVSAIFGFLLILIWPLLSLVYVYVYRKLQRR